MASDYGRNFGFLRSDEHVRFSEGGYRLPAEGDFRMGQVVEIDGENEGYMKLSDANVAAIPGVVGILLQELEHERSIYESSADLIDSRQMGVAKNNRLSIITGGAGTKIWLRNTESETRADGRVIDAVTMIDIDGLGVTDGVCWDGEKFVEFDDDDFTNVLARVTAIDADAARVELVLV